MNRALHIILFLGLTACLLTLTLVRIYDPDFGFYLAIGRHTLSDGIPQTEFFVPLLGDQAFSSLHLLSSAVLALAWEVGGPAGFVVLKALCYSGAFLFVAAAAMRRGVEPLIATTVSAIAACAVAARFVERPGMFSALFLGVFVYVFSGSEEKPSFVEQSSLNFGVLLGYLSLCWAWMHAEWYVGMFVLGCLLWSVNLSLRVRVAIFLPAVLLPYLAFLLIHPAGLKPILEPLGFIGGGGAERFNINEYSLQLWKLMPLAFPLLMLQLGTGVWLATKRRWAEAVMVGALALLCVKIPRAALPALIVGASYISEFVAQNLEKRLPKLGVRTASLAAILFIAGAFLTVHWLPGRNHGFTVDAALDMRGVGDVLEQVTEREGPILSEFVWGSALLSQPGAVRQGIVMDGRQEAYRGNEEYINSVARMLTEEYWEGGPEDSPVAFYFEPFPSGRERVRLAGLLRSRGWDLIAWDDSGRLFARPGIAEEYGLTVYQADPALPPEPGSVGLYADETLAQAVELQVAGYPAGRALTIAARAAMLAGRQDIDPVSLLEQARAEGAERYLSWWEAMAAADVEHREEWIKGARQRFPGQVPEPE